MREDDAPEHGIGHANSKAKTRGKVSRPYRRKALLAAKLATTLILCVIIAYRVDWTNLTKVFYSLDPRVYLIVIPLMLFNVVISALKWKVLLTIHAVNVSLTSLTGYYLTGQFFSKFLPGTIGGDGYRGYKIYKKSGSKSAAMMPIFIERITGIITLTVLGFLGGIATYIHQKDSVTTVGILISGTGSALCLIILMCLFSKKVVDFLMHIGHLPSLAKKFLKQLSVYTNNSGKLLSCFLMSMIFVSVQIFGRLLLLYSTGANCSIFALAFVMMLSILAAQVPLSLNGIGLMDGSFVILAGNYGVPEENALTVMLLYRGLSIGTSFIGILPFLKERRQGESTRMTKDEAELLAP
jgi:uncharacterized protein (TIRG00374 family)